MARLFEPLLIGDLRLDNRIVIAPMCQYSASNGTAGDWHMIHLGHLALSGAGLMILEATAISPDGRISPQDLGLYSDENENALAKILTAVRAHSPIAVALQLSHAGRKASSRAPWEGGAQIRPDEPLGWKTEAPSPVPHAEGEDIPLALDRAGLALQLHCSSEVSAASIGLVSSPPERPCENVVDRDAPLSELDSDAADFLDRPADQERCLVRRRRVFLSAGSALAR